MTEFRTAQKKVERLIERVELKNGLTVELWDRSQEMYSRRWLARLAAKIAVPLEPSFFGDDQEALEELREEYGVTVEFNKEMQRLFVPEDELAQTLGAIAKDFRENTLKYLENSKFAGRFALKTLSELREKKRLDKLMGRG